ncbi:site-specific DNA-methyltransferase [Mycolicibacterium fortuitum]|uniref:site-specific DNA-methyltransferase n=1 Tax=Mycolicibacterium fortuitum TaxID=1766 RepID=UPI003AABF110
MTETNDTEPVRQESGLHMHWHGRRSYRTRVPSPRVLEIDRSNSYGEYEGNMVIEGDNLQVMLSLRSQYNDSFDVVYIDPPYNRGGNDFRYSDARFRDPDADGNDAVYVSNEDGERHTKWLNFMAPRLVAIRNLMAEHGVIFMSINDVELGRLLMLADEIFDESNRIAVITWRGSSDNNPSRVVIEHEYILCYAKNLRKVPTRWSTPEDLIKDALIDQYELLINEESDAVERAKKWKALIRINSDGLGKLKAYDLLDDRGPYQSARRVHNPKPGGYKYGVSKKGIVKPTSREAYAMPLNGYRFPPARMQQLIDDGRIVFPARKTQIVQMKDYLTDYRGTLRSVIDIDARAGSYRLKALFGEDFDGFRFPKPVELIQMLVGAAGGPDALVLDAFAGSGTTGDAVLQLNKVDGGRRRFVLIEEGNGEDQYARTLIADRMRRVIELEQIDTGFVFMTTGAQLDRAAILNLERDKISAVICQTDRSGTKAGIKPIHDGKLVIGSNARGEAIALVWNGAEDSRVDTRLINEAVREASSLGLKVPVRIYGTTCTVSETRSFIFCQIPDEILASLQVDEQESSEE